MISRSVIAFAIVASVVMPSYGQLIPDTAQAHLCFPQFADGGPVQTIFTFANSYSSAVPVTLDLMRDDGSPLTMDFGLVLSPLSSDDREIGWHNCDCRIHAVAIQRDKRLVEGRSSPARCKRRGDSVSNSRRNIASRRRLPPQFDGGIGVRGCDQKPRSYVKRLEFLEFTFLFDCHACHKRGHRRCKRDIRCAKCRDIGTNVVRLF